MIDECMFHIKNPMLQVMEKQSCKYMYVIQVELMDKLMFVSKFCAKFDLK